MTFGLFEGASLVEMLIFGFIGSNILLSASYLIIAGFKRDNGANPAPKL